MKIFDLETHKFADIFPMTEGEQAEQLKIDINENGLQQSVVLFEGKILDGRNRYRACKELGIEPKIEYYEGEKPLEFVISGNLKRRHLTPDQRAVIAQEVMPMLEDEAKKRKATSNANREKIPTSEKGRPSEKAGKMFNVNERYIRDIKKLKEEGRQEKVEEIRSGKITLQDLKKEDRLEKIKQQREELQKQVLEQPTGLFDVIVIDPPWRYDGDIFKENENQLPSFNPEGMRGTTPYITMSLEEIRNIKLPVKDDCVLWLWTTNLFLLEMKGLLESWGFELKSILTWDKQHIGTGRWLRSQTEHCILAIKGKPFFNNTKWSTLISEKRTTHSTKPEIFYEMVDEICAGRKLDYFARTKREGWDVYGNEVNNDTNATTSTSKTT